MNGPSHLPENKTIWTSKTTSADFSNQYNRNAFAPSGVIPSGTCKILSSIISLKEPRLHTQVQPKRRKLTVSFFNTSLTRNFGSIASARGSAAVFSVTCKIPRIFMSLKKPNSRLKFKQEKRMFLYFSTPHWLETSDPLPRHAVPPPFSLSPAKYPEYLCPWRNPTPDSNSSKQKRFPVFFSTPHRLETSDPLLWPAILSLFLLPPAKNIE